MNTAVEEFLSGLRGRGINPKKTGSSWQALCPVHEADGGSHRPSLSISVGNKKPLVLFCHANCPFEDILAAVGLVPLNNLFDTPIKRQNKRNRIVAEYQYHDETGSVLYECVRSEDKDFRFRRPGNNGSWIWNLNNTRRVLYRLPDVIKTVADGGTVFITEGEKDANAINELPDAGNIIATTNLGGAGKWRDEYAGALRGAEVIVVQDKDEPGRKHARKIAESLKGIAGSVAIVEAKEGKDSSDHISAGFGLDDFIPAGGDGNLSPVDSTIETWPAPPTEAAYYGILGEIVRVIEPSTEADPVGILAQLLIGLGSLIGGRPYYQVEGTRHRVNEFLVLVGRTAGGRKGTSWDRARGILAGVDEEWASERILGGLSSGEGLINSVRDAREEEKAVMEKGRCVDYTTIRVDPGVSDKRLLVIEPELSRVLKVMARDGNTLSTIIRQAWDGQNLRVMTKKMVKATGAHISIIAHITSEELIRLLTETDAASGFGNRFLWLSVKRSQLLPDGGTLDLRLLDPLRDKLSEAIRRARGSEEIIRDPEARELWCEEYARLSTGKPGLLGSILSRAEPHVLRLSMLYALADSETVIRRAHLEAALALWDFSARSAAFIFGRSLGDPTADELLGALRSAPKGMTRWEISSHFAGNKKKSDLDRALESLARMDLVSKEFEKSGGRGRPTETWTAVREVKE